MGGNPVTAIWGIGNRIAARLGELGIVTVEDLARAAHNELARSFGPPIGPHLRVLALGGDDSPMSRAACGAVAARRRRSPRMSPTRAIAEHVDRLAAGADVVSEAVASPTWQ